MDQVGRDRGRGVPRRIGEMKYKGNDLKKRGTAERRYTE